MKSYFEVVNLTPHPITLAGNSLVGSCELTLPACKEPARVEMEEKQTDIKVFYGRCIEDGADDLFAMPVMRVTKGEVKGLPDPSKGTVYIVSSMVAERVKRKDVFSPGHLVRDEQGRVTGCKALIAES